ncbi:SLC13/DASS family transporter [Marinihelvus fidelis]|uniref:SLC13/DASS family transporter n=1 Tax=Marinihelvus fidelis TaxID=2613842 RepID=A0A5N0TC36_9GAMM|nr:SLC13 family permease [Marinihelvus fidelis]KAA9130899.1 SLC13/DASS family transporter [Marinihelvus fidelis]
MTPQMILVFAVTAVVFFGFIRERQPPDIIALLGVALLLLTGALSTPQLLSVFSSGAPITIAAMFVLSKALENTGIIASLGALAGRLAGASWLRAMLLLMLPVTFVSAFANNTPVVVVLTPVIITLAHRQGIAASRYLIPLSYASILGGTCTLVGTSTNLLVDGIAQREGLAPFGIFDITLVGVLLAVCGLAYLLLFGWWLLPDRAPDARSVSAALPAPGDPGDPAHTPRRRKAPLAVAVILAVVTLAALHVLPIVSLAVIGAIVVVAAGCLTAGEAYRAVHWPIIMLIFAMLAIGLALEQTGAMRLLVNVLDGLTAGLGPVGLLLVIYVVTSIATEFMSNNAAAILFTPVAIGAALAAGLDPKPFVVAVMMAGSASFATPIGYQTNTIVYRAGGYRFSDFLRIGLPMNLLAMAVTVLAIPRVWPLQAG